MCACLPCADRCPQFDACMPNGRLQGLRTAISTPLFGPLVDFIPSYFSLSFLVVCDRLFQLEYDNLYFRFAVQVGHHGPTGCKLRSRLMSPQPPFFPLARPHVQAQQILPAGAGGRAATRDSGPSGRERTRRWRCHLRRLCCRCLRRWHGESDFLFLGRIHDFPPETWVLVLRSLKSTACPDKDGRCTSSRF